jgi:hypothetical protein
MSSLQAFVQKLCVHLPMHATRHVHHGVDLVILIIFFWRVQITKFHIMQLSQAPVTSPFLGQNILLSTLTPCFALTVTDRVSHPIKGTGKITVLYILIFKFYIEDGKTKDSDLRGRPYSYNSSIFKRHFVVFSLQSTLPQQLVAHLPNYSDDIWKAQEIHTNLFSWELPGKRHELKVQG